ncbi:hypothetical protein [Flexithrix dorotheae]|uniref:hypothetical protein n=1 Tax=Flexithrix dorotheae TaxID=70993 RepID=UPI0003640EE2|nr:hypothetical protein [Flexithrix dorotheae]
MMENGGINLVELLDKHGLFAGVLYAIALIFLFQLFSRREQATDAFINFSNKMAYLIHHVIIVRNRQFIQGISDRISSIYTYMYMLMKISPVRIAVFRFDYKEQEKEKFYKCYMVHEAVSGVEPIKDFWQGIQINKQVSQVLIVDTISEGSKGLYLSNLEEMPDGELKDTLDSYDIRSIFSIYLNNRAERVYSLVVFFNREKSLEQSDIATIRLCAANIEKLIFS